MGFLEFAILAVMENTHTTCDNICKIILVAWNELLAIEL